MLNFNKKIEEHETSIKLKQYATNSNNDCFINVNETEVLAMINYKKSEEIRDFLMLTVNYVERFSAVGKIPGGFIKREAKPCDESILTSRIIDRVLRPSIKKGFSDELQIVVMPLSIDDSVDMDVLSINVASITLATSQIPIEYLTAATEIKDDETKTHLKIAGNKNFITMIEGEMGEISHEQLLKYMEQALIEIKKNIIEIESIVEEVKPEKFEIKIEATKNIEMVDEVTDIFKEYSKEKWSTYKKEILSTINDEEKYIKMEIALEETFQNVFRKEVLNGDRIDGRKHTEIRNLTCDIDVLKRPHGSALFSRGDTRCLSSLTLGSLYDAQKIDGLNLINETKKRFMLHYNFDSYSVGEVGRIGFVSRREIGHGTLGEKALAMVLPDEKDFPYTICLTNDILSSNGSTSQASICAGSLALMAGGVPIKEAVAGIALGMVKEGDKSAILTDILGVEDHYGDLDFKIAGTKNGLVAIQADVKDEGLSIDNIKDLLLTASSAHTKILKEMNGLIKEPKKNLGKYAPKFKQIKIEKNKIKMVIGRGGENIDKIIEKTNVKIDILDDGTVFVLSQEEDKIDEAIKIIMGK